MAEDTPSALAAVGTRHGHIAGACDGYPCVSSTPSPVRRHQSAALAVNACDVRAIFGERLTSDVRQHARKQACSIRGEERREASTRPADGGSSRILTTSATSAASRSQGARARRARRRCAPLACPTRRRITWRHLQLCCGVPADSRASSRSWWARGQRRSYAHIGIPGRTTRFAPRRPCRGIAKYGSYDLHLRSWRNFIGKLQETKDVDGTLLDRRCLLRLRWATATRTIATPAVCYGRRQLEVKGTRAIRSKTKADRQPAADEGRPGRAEVESRPQHRST